MTMEMRNNVPMSFRMMALLNRLMGGDNGAMAIGDGAMARFSHRLMDGRW
jgi:hypothetical protein